MKTLEERFEQFKQKSTIKFGDQFDYSKVEYKKAQEKVILICKKHGEFITTPATHLNSSTGACPKCSKERIKNRMSDTQETFITKMKAKYGDLYTYEKTKYMKSSQKVIVTGPSGDIIATPNFLLQKKDNKETMQGRAHDLQGFINKANKVHNFKYDYSKTVYTNRRTKVCIICPIHGEFWQTCGQHLNGHGCQACGHQVTISHTKSNTEEFVKKARTI